MLDVVHEDEAGPTLVGRVMRAVRELVATRSAMPGARLPSIRRMAETQGVSKSTVVEAYDRLAAEGVVVSRPGSGFFVAGRMPVLRLAEAGPKLDRVIDPFWVARQSLETPAEVLKPGWGCLPDDWLPQEALRRAFRAMGRDASANLTAYGSPLGLPALRAHIARSLNERGIEVEPQAVVLADSDSVALDLVCRLLLRPGDTVMVDDPCYFNFQALLRAQRVDVVGVPVTPAGPDIERFAALAAEHRPRLYLSNAALQNPTGATLSSAVAHRLLQIAEAHDLTIVEDDTFGEFEVHPTPRLAALDGLRRVIHVGSFSKTVSAAARVGFVAARPDWVEELLDLKLATGFGNGDANAQIVHRVLTDGAYRRSIERLRTRLAGAMTLTLQRLKPLGLTPWIEPRAGMFLWAELPEGLDSAVLARRALERGVVLAPGNVFSVSQTAGRFLRFNVSQCAAPRIFEVLGEVMRR